VARLVSLQDVKDYMKGGAALTGEAEKALKLILDKISQVLQDEILGSPAYSLKQATSNGTDSPVERYGTEHYGLHRRDTIRLARFPVVTVLTVDDDGSILPAASYQVDTAAAILRLVTGAFSAVPYAVKVNYTAGYLEAGTTDATKALAVPDDLKWAALQQVVYEFTRREPGSMALGATSVVRPDGSMIVNSAAFLPEVKATLARYRRAGF
jgi:hypothetical protein